MSDWVQWGITTIVGIIGIFIGREWQKLDKKNTKDKETLKMILQILPSIGSIAYIRDHDFGAVFDVDKLDDLFRFTEAVKRPEFTFIDKQLERAKQELVNAVNKFNYDLGMKSFSFHGQTSRHLNEIPRPDEIGDDEFRELRNYFNDLSTQVCVCYDDLVKTANKKL